VSSALTLIDQTAAAIAVLKECLEERIEAFCVRWEIADGETVEDVFWKTQPEQPLTSFLYDVVFDHGDMAGIRFLCEVDDADEESWAGFLMIMMGDTLPEPEPVVFVWVDWRHVEGRDGLRELAENIYDDFSLAAAAWQASTLVGEPEAKTPVPRNPES